MAIISVIYRIKTVTCFYIFEDLGSDRINCKFSNCSTYKMIALKIKFLEKCLIW